MTIEKVTLGCDPEWGILNEHGSIVRPDEVISNELNEQFGIDGSERVAELRPTYANNPRGLVKNIRALLQEGLNVNPVLANYRWKAGSMVDDEPIGGHVHLGHKALISGEGMRNNQKVSQLTTTLIRIVSPLMLMAEDKEEAIARRVGTGYGSLKGGNCMREQAYGVEYRTLPSWLTSPEDALSVLSLVHLCAVNINNERFLDTACSLPEIEDEAFTDCNKKVASYYLGGIAKALKTAEGFADYLPDMQHLFNLIIDRKEFNTNQDMKDSWGLKMPDAATVAKAVATVKVSDDSDDEDEE